MVEGDGEKAMRLECEKMDLDKSGSIEKEELSKLFMDAFCGIRSKSTTVFDTRKAVLNEKY